VFFYKYIRNTLISILLKIPPWKPADFTFLASLSNSITEIHVSFLCDYVTSQLHNTPSDYAREMFKASKDAFSLLIWIFKIFLKDLGFGFFVGDAISGIGLSLLWPRSLGPGPQLQEPIF